MKDMFKITFMTLFVLLVYIFRSNISNFITDEIIYRGNNKILTYNEYYLNNNYLYVQNLDTKDVKNYNEVLNMFYTIINSGDDNFSFYCNYDSCISDVKKLTKDEDETVANINNFVHPFNSFASININIASSGKITVKTKKVYSDDQISYIKSYIEKFNKENIDDSMSDYDKIKKFHDFIINTTEYDQDNKRDSYTAFDLITTGKSICGGYSDIMAIYLNTLGIKNYKITSKNHIWNLVYINGNWLHLDATWDDPVASDGKQYLIHNFFLISTDELLKLDKVEHNFDENIYLEAKIS